VTTGLRDIARFTCDDRSELVEAALSCSVCLRPPAVAVISGDEYESVAICDCPDCHTATEVGLNPEQFMRLQVAPPAHPALKFL
jgi:hypothetical protein